MVKQLSVVLFTVLITLVSSSLQASTSHQIKSIEFQELPVTASHQKMLHFNTGIGDIISMGTQIVALGESIYNLVQKGKPSIKVGEFDPINVVPRLPGTNTYVHPMDVYGTVEEPMVKRYRATVKNMLNMNVVTYEFLLQFEYGGKYDEKGAYIQNAFIVPSKVDVAYGWDFAAQMKLIGISNSGTKDNPIATATLSIKHSFGSVLSAESNDFNVKITGKGKVITNQ
jgi:hypothetical protein